MTIDNGVLYTSLNGRVIITDPESTDAGIYNCIARNGIGDVSVTVNLSQAGMCPHSVYELIV